MQVIVEGPDGSGKTTLAQRLSEDLEIPYMRYEGLSSTEGPTDPGIVNWWGEHLSSETPGVYDRCFWISELLYQPVMSGRPLILTGPEMATGIHDLWVADPSIVFCMTDWETEEPTIQSRPQLQDVTLNSMMKIHWAYWSIFAMWQEMLTTVRHYDYRTSSYDLLKRAING